MVARSRVLRVAAWVAAVVGAMLLVLTFVLREHSYRVHPDLIHALMYPVPAVVVVALLAGALVAGGLPYAFVYGKCASLLAYQVADGSDRRSSNPATNLGWGRVTQHVAVAEPRHCPLKISLTLFAAPSRPSNTLLATWPRGSSLSRNDWR